MADTQMRLTRAQLAEFLPDARAIKTFEQLMLASGTTLPDGIVELERLVDEVTVDAGTADSKADLALSLLANIEANLAMVTLSPANIPDEPPITAGTTAQYWRGDKTWRDFMTDVRATTLTGLSTAVNAVITAADTVLSALGKLQKQFSDHFASTVEHGATGAVVGTTNAQILTNKTLTSPILTTPIIGAATGTSLSVTGQLTSTLAVGTPPLVVTSTTNIPNLNASTLSGATFASPGPIGSIVASTAVFTTCTVSSVTAGAGILSLTDTGGNGVGIQMNGSGGVAASKFVRVNAGNFQIINSAYSALIFQVSDTGAMSVFDTITYTNPSNVAAAIPTVASAGTIAITTPIAFVSGVAAIATITAPAGLTNGGQITIIPTGLFTTTAAGNIALASTAVVSKALIMTYSASTSKWYPSY